MIALGIDAGSSSIKCALVDIASGRILSTARYPEQEMEIVSIHAGWAEQHPEVWWNFTCKAIEKVCGAAEISPSQIVCIGIGYQMHGLVVVDVNGIPLRSSIIWCDSRAVNSGKVLANVLASSVIEENLLNHPGNFTASKLSWVKEHEPEIYGCIHKVMLPGDYLAFKMTGAYTTTWSGLSEGIWYDFRNDCLSRDMLAAGNHDANIFPLAGSCFETLCTTNEAFFQITGIKSGTPVSFRAGDQPCNAYALGVLEPGQAAATGGTSGVVYAVSDAPHHNTKAGFNTFLHVNHQHGQNRLGNLLCINGTGIMYKWIRNQAFPGQNYDEMVSEVMACPSGSEGLTCLPFGNGAERMLHNLNPGAAYIGLDLNRHNRSHMARAALEGIAFAFAFGMKRMAAAGITIKSLRTGNDNLFRSEVFSSTLANVSGIPIEMYQTTGAVGAAMGAAYGAGIIDSPNRVGEVIEYLSTVEPKPMQDSLVRALDRWQDALEHSIRFISN